MTITTTHGVSNIPIDSIDVHVSSRPVDAEHVRRLAESIAEHGLQSPITVYLSGARYVLGDGRHRLEACRKLGMEELLAICRAETADDDIRVGQLVANLHRRDMLPIEEAEGVAELLAAYRGRGDAAPVERVAAALGRPETWVRERMYLDRLAPRVRELARIAEIPAGHLRELARVGDVQRQQELAAQCAGSSWWQIVERDDEDEVCGWDADEIAEIRDRIATRTTSRPTIAEIRETVDTYLRPLRGVPWELSLPVIATDGRELRPCDGCPHNSGSDRVLFAVASDAKHEVCADGACYAAKREAADRVRTKIEGDLARRKTPATLDHVRAKAPDWMRATTVSGIARKHAAKHAANGKDTASTTAPAAARPSATGPSDEALRAFADQVLDWSESVSALLTDLLTPLELVLLNHLSATGDNRIVFRTYGIDRGVHIQPTGLEDVDPSTIRADDYASATALAELARQRKIDCVYEEIDWLCLPRTWVDALGARYGVVIPPDPVWDPPAPAEPPKQKGKKPRGQMAAANDRTHDEEDDR
ncbi:MAG TPA: ParB/RepB/Spo0J family partition protein [Phycisphaerales bacterium]|nr:ParB/RepB/Spo0J family partition protein [Phycisphaerales bacterium]HMP37011.1 ParB/RepB/Spo0J family partition protein [Phycisphaerales bacterium]